MNAASLDSSLKPVRIRRVLSHARGVPVTDPLESVGVSDGEAMLVWTAAALAARQPVSEEKQETLVTLLADKLVAIGNRLSAGSDVAAFLVINDLTLVVVSGMDCFLDLRTGDFVPAVNRPSMETTAFNLTEIFKFHKQRLAKEGQPCPTS